MPGIDIARVLQVLSIAIIPGLFAITLHEVAHGWTARRFGDQTAYMLGRLTLNPLKHIDPMGTVVVPIAMLLISSQYGQPMAFGWAKPVPVSFRNLRNPRRDMVLVAAAGPASNFLMATGWALIGALQMSVLQIGGAPGAWLIGVCVFGIFFNVLLAIVNLLPVPPLDGGRVLSGLLPPRASDVLDRIEPFGIIIVILLMVTGVLWTLIEPYLLYFNDFFRSIAGIP